MSERAMDEGSALSLHHSSQGRHPDDEVQDIVQRVKYSTSLNPTVEKFLEDHTHKELFHEVLTRQANLIKSRIQSFDVGHVTVYDKVLLALTENGIAFDSVVAQEYFCGEFLGIDKDGKPPDIQRILQANVVVKAILAQAAYPQGRYKEKYSAENSYGDKGQRQPKDSPATTGVDDSDAKFSRLISVYKKANSDFEAVRTSDAITKLEAARFLRDTAENTLQYFRNPSKSSASHAEGDKAKELMADLGAKAKMAQASIVILTGGRTRKFDNRTYEAVPRGPRAAGYRGETSNRQGRGDFNGRAGRDSREASPGQKWHNRYREDRRDVAVFHQGPRHSTDHPDASGDYPQTSRDYHDSSRQYPEASRDYPESSHEHPSEYRRTPAYSRPVDSYQTGPEPEPEPESFSSQVYPYEYPHNRQRQQRRYREPSSFTFLDYKPNEQHGYGSGYGHAAYEPTGGSYADRYAQRGGTGGVEEGEQNYEQVDDSYTFRGRRAGGEGGDTDAGAEYQSGMGY